MDLEHLTKSQVVLLALLVAIVSSVATGIVTVSLMGQAPPAVAANVGNIIERTVSQVVFATSTPPASAPTKTTAAPVVPASPATAIAAVQKSVIRIVVTGDVAQKLVARGVIVGKDGTALTDASSLEAGMSYQAILWDGSKAAVTFTPAAASSSLQKITLTTASSTVFVPASSAALAALQLGTSIVRLGGTGSTAAAAGIIASLPDASAPQIIGADVSSQTPGSIIIDLSGAVIGMTTASSLAIGPTSYTLLTNH